MGTISKYCWFYLLNISVIHSLLSNHPIPSLDQITIISSLDNLIAFLPPVLPNLIHSPKCDWPSLYMASLMKLPSCLKVFRTRLKSTAWQAGPSWPAPDWPASLLAPLTPSSRNLGYPQCSEPAMAYFISGSLSLQLPPPSTCFTDPQPSSSLTNSPASSAQFNKNSSLHLMCGVLFRVFSLIQPLSPHINPLR